MNPRVLLIALPLLVAACASGPSPVTGGQTPAAATPATSAPAAATPAPGVELALQSFDGRTVRLSDFRGKAVLVNSWAAWCPFCVAEIPDLERAGLAFGDRAVVLFVQRTGTESRETGERFLMQREADSGLTIPRGRVLLDPDDSFYRTHFGFGMPVSLFVDPSGRVADKKIGVMDQAEAKQRLEKVLGS